jgi:Ca-activated chloride channel family protein
VSFARPIWLAGLPAALAAGAVLVWISRRALASVRRIDPSFPRGGLWKRAVLPSCTLGLLFVALAGPTWGLRETAADVPETDVVLLLDTSGSMLARDVTPDRFTRAKMFARELLRRLPANVRVGLVRVEGDGEVISPLTLDREALANELDELAVRGAQKPGSDLGRGLEKAEALLAGRGSRGRAIVLLSDGEDLESRLATEAQRCRQLGIAVEAAGAPVPARGGGFLVDAAGHPVVSRARPDAMRRIARETGGVSADFSGPESPAPRIASAVASLQRGGRGRRVRQPADRSAWPLAAAVVAWTAWMWPRREVRP